MSRGLILGSMGQAVANSGQTISSMMVRSAEDDERRADRDRERDEQRQFQAEQNALYRRPADQIGAGRAKTGGAGGAGDGISLEDMGVTAGGLVAGKMGMTDAELAAYDEARKTGNFDQFKTGKRAGEYGDAGPEQVDPKEFEAARADYPPGVSEDSIRAKLKQIADVRTSLAMGKDNKGYEDGNQTRQEIEASSAALADPKRAGVIGQAIAAGQGKEIVGGDSNVTRNNYTGATSVTPVGSSVISENNAQGAKAVAGKNDETLKALTQERILATNAAAEAGRELKQLQSMTKEILRPAEKAAHAEALRLAKEKVTRYEEQRDGISSRVRQFTETGKVAAKAEAPKAKASAPPGKKDHSSLWK